MDLPAIFQRLLPDDAHVQEELSELLQPELWQSESSVSSHDWAAVSQSKATLWSFCAPLREALGIDNAGVLISLLHKHYCQQTLGRQAALTLLNRPTINLSAQVSLAAESQRLLWRHSLCQHPLDLPQLVAQTHQRLASDYRHWRALGIGPGVYWSNAALALVMPWNLLLGHVRESEELGQASQAFLAAFGGKLAAQLQWLGVRQHGRRHWLPKRLGCCLQYQCTRGEGRCGTCSLRSQEQFLELVAAHYGPVEEDSTPLASSA